MAQQKLTRAAATVVMVLGVTVIGGSIAGGIALAGGDGGRPPAVSDPSGAADATDPAGDSAPPGPADDRHGDETICEAGDDCGGMTTPTASTDDDPDGASDDDDSDDDDHDDDHDDEDHD